MGGDWQKPEGRIAPGGVERVVAIMRPLATKVLVAARTLPGRTREYIERADLPRRLEEGRKWIEARDFPARGRRFAHAAAKAGLAAAGLAQRMAAGAAARMGPLASSVHRRLVSHSASLAAALSRRSAALAAGLAERRAAAAARRAGREAIAKPPKTPEPVPSELMRLLKEEGVEVEGMDVREALPEPVRPLPVQGVLPLFAEEISALSGKNR